MLDGKRTERLPMPTQLRASAEMAEDVRFLSRLNNRSISLQILHWIGRGIKEDKAKLSQAASQGVTGARPMRVTKRQISSEEGVA